jgi:hypothetical protein
MPGKSEVHAVRFPFGRQSVDGGPWCEGHNQSTTAQSTTARYVHGSPEGGECAMPAVSWPQPLKPQERLIDVLQNLLPLETDLLNRAYLAFCTSGDMP